MEKRVIAVIGMLLMGYVIKLFIDYFPTITSNLYSFFAANHLVTIVFIACLVLIAAFTVTYKLIKLFLKWQDSDSGKSESK